MPLFNNNYGEDVASAFRLRFREDAPRIHKDSQSDFQICSPLLWRGAVGEAFTLVCET